MSRLSRLSRPACVTALFLAAAAVHASPDLIPQNVTLGAASVAAGGNLSVTFTIRNQGTTAAPATMTGLVLSASANLGGLLNSDPTLREVTTSALTAGASSITTTSVTIPPATPPGTYYIWVVADFNLTAGQSDENNDFARSPAFTVTGTASVFPESPHPYPDNYDNTFAYTLPGTGISSINVTFDPLTATEPCCDFIHIMESNGSPIPGSPFSGNQLAGQTKTVPGATVRIRLVTDGSIVAYGFKVSNVVAASTTPTTPGAPSNLAAFTISSTQINLSWTDNSNNETSFRIERRTAGGAFATIATVGANTTSYQNTGLSAGTQYFFRIRAENNTGSSAYTPEVSATTSGTAGGPYPESPHPYPDNYDNTQSYTLIGSGITSINVTFDPQTLVEFGFDYIHVTDGGGAPIPGSPFTGNQLAGQTRTVPGATVRIRLTSDGSVTYFGYRVTNIVAGSTAGQTPAAPSGMTATAVSTSQINLSWTDNSSNETGFRVERRTATGSYATVAIVGANVTAYQSTGLAAATQYLFRVRAENAAGFSAYTAEASATTSAGNTGGLYPESPHPYPDNYDNTWTYTQPGAGITSIVVTFDPLTSVEFGFDYIHVTDGSGNPIAGSPFTGGQLAGQAKTVPGATVRIRLTSDGSVTAFGFRVTNVVAGGTPGATPPAAPSNLTAVPVSTSQINLSWIDNSSNEATFRIERRTATGTFATIATVGANVTAYQNTGLAAGTTYFFRVRAENAAGNSSYTIESSATTPTTAGALPESPHPYADNYDNTWTYTLPGAPSSINVVFDSQTFTEADYDFIHITDGAGTPIAGSPFTGNQLAGQTKVVPGATVRIRLITDGSIVYYGFRVTGITAGAVIGAPAAPSNLLAIAVSSSQVLLTFRDNSANETMFRVERRTATGAFATAATLAANLTSFVDSGLTAGTTYFYRARAENGSGASAYTAEATATTTGAALALPESPHPYFDNYDNTFTYTLPGSGISTISVTFDPRTSVEQGFDFIHVMDGNGNPIQGSPFTGTQLAAATKVVPGATVRIRLTSDGSVTDFGFKVTNVVSGGAVSGPSVPAAPSNLRATASAGRIDLAWNDNSSNETLFRVERRTGSGSFAAIFVTPASATTIIDTGLTAGTTYFYRVRAENTAGVSAYTSEASATTPGSTSGGQFPESAHPYANNFDNTWTYALAGASIASINVSFDVDTFTEPRFDLIYVMDASGNNIAGSPFSGDQLAGQTKTVPGATVRIRLVTDGSVTYYGFRVTGVVAGGVSATPPASPSGLQARALSPTQVFLLWTDNSNNESSFRLERRSGGAYALAGMVGANGTGFTDGNLTAGVTYTYRLRAENAAGVSAFTAEVSIATPAPGTPLPDLNPLNVTLSVATIQPGGALTVTHSLRNLGDAAATASTTRLRLGTNPNAYSGNDPLLVSVTATSVAPGQLLTASNLPITIPAATTPGTYYVWARADALGVLTQSNTANDFARSGAIVVTSTAAPVLPESAHPYTNNFDFTWAYTRTGNPSSINVTFDSQTYTEPGFDFIHVTDNAGNPIPGSPFDGADLAGRTVTVPGATVRIRLVTDASLTYYGFRVTSVEPGTPVVISARPNIFPSFAPSPTAATDPQPVDFVGTGFQQGMTAAIGFPNGGGANVAVQLINSNSFRILAALNTPGVWTIRVTNPDGQQSPLISFTVRPGQAPPTPCSFQVSPTAVILPAGGGTGRVGVTTTSECDWTATSTDSFLSIVSAGGRGSGTAEFSASANNSPNPRSGRVTVAGRTVDVTQSGAARSYSVSPASLLFSFRESGPAPPDQVLTLLSQSPGVSFTATTRVNNGPDWLKVVPAAGPVPGTVVVSVTAPSLTAGVYTGEVILNCAQATPPERRIPVEVRVAPPGLSRLAVAPTSLAFSFFQGGAPATGRLVVSNLGERSAPFGVAAISVGDWLSASPANAEASGALPVIVTVIANPQQLGIGTFNGIIKLTSSITGQALEIPVTATVSANEQGLLLSQSGMTFTAVAGGGAVPSDTFAILNRGRGVMNWSASTSVSSPGGVNWLRATPGTGATDGDSTVVPEVTVTVDHANLPPGPYYGQIEVTSPTADNSPQVVSVVLNVLSAGSDIGPVLRPTSLTFSGNVGAGNPPPKNLVITNVSADAVQFSAGEQRAVGQKFLDVRPVNGPLQPGQFAPVAVQPVVGNLPPGFHTTNVVFAVGKQNSIDTVLSANVLLFLLPPRANTATGVRAAEGDCQRQQLYPVFASISRGFSTGFGWPRQLEVRVVDNCGVPMTEGSVSLEFSNGDPPLQLISLKDTKDGRWHGTWQPRFPDRNVRITAYAVAPDSQRRWSEQVLGEVFANSDPPVVMADGVSPLEGRNAVLSPGGLIQIEGVKLAPTDENAPPGGLPLQMAGTLVVVGGRRMPLRSVSDSRIVAQVPFNVSLDVPIQMIIRRGTSQSAPQEVRVARARPTVGVIRNESGGELLPDGTAVRAGDRISVFGYGFGAVRPEVPPGTLAPQSPPAEVVAPVSATIGGVEAEVKEKVLQPNEIGLYRIDLIVPPGVPAGGAVQMVLRVANQSSTPKLIAVAE